MSNRILIKGIPFDQTTRSEAVKTILNFLKQKKQFLITTPNPEFLVEAEKNPEFKKILQKSDLSVADGIGILWASTFLDVSSPRKRGSSGTKSDSSNNPRTPTSLDSRFHGNDNRSWRALKTLFWTLFTPKKIRKILPERVCGSDLFLDLCQKSNAKIFLLGAAEGVAKKTDKILKKKNPEIQIVGTYAGSPAEKEEKKITDLINKSGAEILFVAYGSPKQEFWIDRNLNKMQTVKVAIGIGGSFDFVAGTQKRAPNFFRKIGLEWLYRVIREPKRFKRIWNATFIFIKMITKK